ncbi:protein involved in gliding motility SprA [Sinomicrobium oceani]|uniref:Protein involved in gliding motility SprA n=1 Tax=Sinomicrobium oceani TaxID=1150368 RepID=A0A1K1R212_9FLAO|nr:cell surface protein SprA [Sinomicrobium oceani]SFW65622.1 protein involved in gliding motility SprA [Sinomicrobium oceani]
MKTITNLKNTPLRVVFWPLFLLCVSVSFAQEETETQEQDTLKGTAGVPGEIRLKLPESISSKYVYDPVMDMYIYSSTIDGFDIDHPVILTPEQFRELERKESMKRYFKQKMDAISGQKEGSEEAQKDLLPDFYVNSSFFESIFGGTNIDIVPQGSVAVDLGVLYNRNDNPSFSPRNRSTITFDFDQRISMSLLGKVGEKMSVMANYDTQATFDFQNLIKLEYAPTEDDIIQKIEVGNVSMPLNSSLITGAQSLFGVKTELQFGKTRVTGVFSEQRSETRSVVAQGGGTVDDFELFALDYDEDRHFFLSHFFRDQYDQALANYPFINSQVQITRIEVWVTNRGMRIDNIRNIVGIQDLGEADPENTRINTNAPGGFFNPGTGGLLPRNDANDYNPKDIGGSSVLTEQIRDVSTVQSGFGTLSSRVNQGYDYAILENAQKLIQGTDFTFDPKLGYISLNQRLSNDEVLAVAYQYTYRGQAYQVGEFANDGVNATEYETGANGQVVAVNNQTLVVKLLKSNVTNVSDPIWDLMMKNIYATGAYQLSQEDFKMNILYRDPSPVNYIKPVDESSWPAGLQDRILLDVFNFDRLNAYNDPQTGGDGFFDYLPGITIDPQTGRIIFTKVEPFGQYLHTLLGGGDYDQPDSYNPNQSKYVFRNMYTLTKAAALEDTDKNKFQLKGRYKSEGGEGIPIGAFNVPQGSVNVTAGGRRLQEGIDFTVNYQTGTVYILDEGIKASNVPIEVSVENNSVFGRQTRRFAGVNVEHQFNKNFMLGATLLNMSEKPLTQKASYGLEPVNNTIFGVNGNFSTEMPFLTRWVNKLPNIDTDVPSNLSVRGEVAYLLPGSPKNDNFDGETTVYVDDFEGAQTLIDMRAPLAWSLASTPLEFVPGGELYGSSPNDPENLRNGYKRSKMAWYTIDPIFYTSQKPSGISNDDISLNPTRRIYIDEIFPEIDVSQGETTVQATLDLAYYPTRKGPYNNSPENEFEGLPSEERWGGIMRGLTSTNFEQGNVEYIQFWVMDPYVEGTAGGLGGELVFNLGNISEDILKDGKKQYENGLPGVGSNELVAETSWGRVPSAQSLVYAFDADTQNRALQDVGFDGLDDAAEAAVFTNNPGPDPALDNYEFYISANGSILERYLNYNNPQGNSPVNVGNNNRGSTTEPNVEDVNGDGTMNTINSYYEYRIPIKPNIQRTDRYVSDIKEVERKMPNNRTVRGRWIQFKIPVKEFDDAIGGISDFRSMSFMRMYLTGFSEDVVLRFGTLDLVRGDWRTYTRTLQPDVDTNPDDDGTTVEVNTVNIEENEQRTPIPYRLPPGVIREQLTNNNMVVRQNEQSLSFAVCGLEGGDSRGVYKNVEMDMRQYKRLKMFLHAEAYKNNSLRDGELVAFLRMGTDFSENFYQVEIPLQVTRPGASTSEEVWPELNNMDVALSLFSKIKSDGIANSTLSEMIFYDAEGNRVEEFDPREPGELRVGLKGNPSLGSIRAIMVGVKNVTGNRMCGEVWFNELRLAELDNQGGWAAIAQIDANVADFANVSATGSMSTSGFGAIDQRPNERSREDVMQYGLNTNVNLGQLLPKNWGIQVPLNYSVSEELITPEFDPVYEDLKLQDRINAAVTQSEKEDIRRRAEDYTKRRSINLIGVRKNRGEEQKQRVYDIENFTFNYSYNEVNHRDYEIEDMRDQNIRTGFIYNYNFKPVQVEPFKKNDSILRNRYWQWLKDFNINPLPTNISVNSNITRSFNEQRFRSVSIDGVDAEDQLALPTLQQRNFLFDWQYTINHNITKSLRLNFTASNHNIVRNYYDRDEDDNRIVREDYGIWDGFWNTGDPNRHTQQLQINYELPFSKIPFLNFIEANYTYTGDFDWQRGNDVINEIAGENVNTIQNASTHVLNASMGMDRFYSYLGLKKESRQRQRPVRRRAPLGDDGENTLEPEEDKSSGLANAGIDLLTMIKRIDVSYTDNRGKVLPGYTESVGFIGTLRPSWGFVFGGQSDIRYEAAKKGWLTRFPDLNQQYMERNSSQLNITANLEPTPDLTVDLVANRQYADSYTENFAVNEVGNRQFEYESLLGNQYGDFSISTVLIKTAFSKSDEVNSEAFEEFRQNRKVVANRLAVQRGIDITDPDNLDEEGYPKGYGKNNQAVLLPSFLAAYQGKSVDKMSFGAFRDVPIPNWTVKYTGLMRLDWFKNRFRRFSLGHGYRASYSVNSFRTNLEYSKQNPDKVDQSGNFMNELLYTNVTLVEQFNPLVRVDFEMKNSINIQAEIKRDRALSLSFDNNLLTETTGKEYLLGLGYRFKEVPFTTGIGGTRQTLKGDINLKADLSLRDNITIIRNLDLDNNQVTSGQTIWSVRFTADYALTKNFTTLFFYDHTFSKYAVSTAYPQTTIRSGITLRYNFGN